MANRTSITVGTFFYDLFLYTGAESILNKPYVLSLPFVIFDRSFTHALLFRSNKRVRELGERAKNAERQPVPAGPEMV